MPVSHLGLTVSHIPSATSFYLSALQPLGYRFVGHQGDSIGLGVDDADFFLCQERDGSRTSPNHIAFSADSRIKVRDCYAAALRAGAQPSGAPSYRNDDCGCFNAAVIDLDGNTLEFIFREGTEPESSRPGPPPSQLNRARTWREERPHTGYDDDTRSLARSASRAKSRTQTAMDLVSTASKSTKQTNKQASSPGIVRSRTEPINSGGDNKKFFGTLLGAAAGAAVAYAMVQGEREGARDEADYARSRMSSAKGSRSRDDYEKSTVSRNTSRSSRPIRRDLLALEPPDYSYDDHRDVASRYTSSRRPAPRRSRTYDDSGYGSMSAASNQRDGDGMKRASTFPAELPDYYPKTAPASRRTSRRGSLEDNKLDRHDSVLGTRSHHSRRSSASKASTLKPSRRSSTYEAAVNAPLPYSRATSHVTAAQAPTSQPRGIDGYADPDESDGLGDMKTVVPDDSISCVDFSSKSKKSSSRNSRPSSKRSEANTDRTVRPAKPSGSRNSADALPVRPKEDYHRSRDGKRSTYSYT